MSTWYEIKDKGDVSLSDDGTEIDVLFGTDSWGNYYVTIPVKFIQETLAQLEEVESEST